MCLLTWLKWRLIGLSIQSSEIWFLQIEKSEIFNQVNGSPHLSTVTLGTILCSAAVIHCQSSHKAVFPLLCVDYCWILHTCLLWEYCTYTIVMSSIDAMQYKRGNIFFNMDSNVLDLISKSGDFLSVGRDHPQSTLTEFLPTQGLFLVCNTEKNLQNTSPPHHI